MYKINTVIEALDKGEYAIALNLDLKKAFDLVNHNILLTKLQHYGIRGVALEWFKSYLTKKSQFVNIDNFSSTPLAITAGVPQGSVLAPALFSLFINDISYGITGAQPILFADDTSIVLHNPCIKTLISNTNNVLKDTEVWLENNKLQLNVDKTKYLIFANKNKPMPVSLPNIHFKNCAIKRVTELNFLGIIVDDKLDWSHHIQQTGKKISKTIGLLYRAAEVLNTSTLTNLYYSFCYPHIIYGLLVWGNTYKTHLGSLLTLQKRIIRIITKSQYLASTAEKFTSLKILKIYEVYKLRTGTFMFLFSKRSLPKIFDRFFEFRTLHTYSTRNTDSNIFNIPFCRLTIKQKSIVYQGPNLFNKIYSHISDIKTVHTFKKKYKDILIQTNNV